MDGYGERYKGMLSFHINYYELIRADIVALISMILYIVMFILFEEKMWYIWVLMILSVLLFAYLLQRNIQIFLFYKDGKISIDLQNNLLVYCDYHKKSIKEFLMDEVKLKCFFYYYIDDFGAEDCYLEQRMEGLMNRSLYNEEIYPSCYFNSCAYYLDNDLIELRDLKTEDRRAFVDYMKRNGKYKEIHWNCS